MSVPCSWWLRGGVGLCPTISLHGAPPWKLLFETDAWQVPFVLVLVGYAMSRKQKTVFSETLHSAILRTQSYKHSLELKSRKRFGLTRNLIYKDVSEMCVHNLPPSETRIYKEILSGKLHIYLHKLWPMHRAIHNILETAGTSNTLQIRRDS